MLETSCPKVLHLKQHEMETAGLDVQLLQNESVGDGWRLSRRCCCLRACSVITTSLLPSWCDARQENAICMPHSHLPATKLIHYALFICLPLHTYVCTHKTGSWLPSSACGCVCVFVCACFKVDALSPSKRDLCITGSQSFFCYGLIW